MLTLLNRVDMAGKDSVSDASSFASGCEIYKIFLTNLGPSDLDGAARDILVMNFLNDEGVVHYACSWAGMYDESFVEKSSTGDIDVAYFDARSEITSQTGFFELTVWAPPRTQSDLAFQVLYQGSIGHSPSSQFNVQGSASLPLDPSIIGFSFHLTAVDLNNNPLSVNPGFVKGTMKVYGMTE